jgi:nucleoside-triphosphatase
MACESIVKNIFLTGRHGVGKSYLIRRTLENFPMVSIGGFQTGPVYNREYLIEGYQIRYFKQDGPGWEFASKAWSFLPQYADFGVDSAIFDVYGTLILEEALRNHQIIVLDELGFMEENAFIFQEKVIQCLDSRAIVFGVIKPIRNNFLQKIRDRADVTVMQILPENRENIHQKLVEDIQHLLIRGI